MTLTIGWEGRPLVFFFHIPLFLSPGKCWSLFFTTIGPMLYLALLTHPNPVQKIQHILYIPNDLQLMWGSLLWSSLCTTYPPPLGSMLATFLYAVSDHPGSLHTMYLLARQYCGPYWRQNVMNFVLACSTPPKSSLPVKQTLVFCSHYPFPLSAGLTFPWILSPIYLWPRVTQYYGRWQIGF